MTRIVGPRRFAVAVLAVFVAVAVGVLPTAQPVSGQGSASGSAGTDISLPLTESAVTVRGREPFAAMELTVNQTENLTNQAISLTWEGAQPTVPRGADPFSSHFLQVMQCWGEPDGSVPENPGPPPENCVYGALNPTATQELPGFAARQVTSRAFSHVDFPLGDSDAELGTVDQSGEIYRDFISVDGTVVTDHVDTTVTGAFDAYWLNPFFNSVTSNEVPGARTLNDGTGQLLFTVNTGVQSPGLGCGQKVQPTASGQPTTPRCWIVVVPRGSPEAENVGTPSRPSVGVASSPMRPEAWANRIAVELSFVPIDSPCGIAADQRAINGTELAVTAVSSWQPVLCTQPGRLPYSYGQVTDQLARRQVLSDLPGSPGMVVVNRPHAEGATSDDDPVLYAPIAASATTIGFNIERYPADSAGYDDPYRGTRIANLNLTPRLVAKLLTQSYRSQVEIRGSDPYEWDDGNPRHMLTDPDFLRFNPEFALWQSNSAKNAGGLLLPADTSDLASQMWDWILADPEATAWMAGEADEWGMVVNPVYATTVENNSTGIPFASPTPDSFPKADPYCYQAPTLVSGVVPPPLCALDYFPYTSSMAESANRTARADDGAKTSMDLFAGVATEVWNRSGPQTLARRTIMGATDLPSANRYGVQTASLSRSGDSGADREFIAPDEAGLGTALGDMVDIGGMLRLDQSDVAPGAYPLTTLTYAAIRPLALDADARDDYAAFLEYAAGPGQEPGYDLGQLPPGYLPLPDALRDVTTDVADLVRTLKAGDPVEQPSADPGQFGTPAATNPPSPTGGSSGAGLLGGPGGGDMDSTDDDPGDVADPVEVAAPPVLQPTTDQTTPIVSVGNGRFVVVALPVLALLAALSSLEITKRRRRAVGSAPVVPVDQG